MGLPPEYLIKNIEKIQQRAAKMGNEKLPMKIGLP